jgi:hypothetical protein
MTISTSAPSHPSWLLRRILRRLVRAINEAACFPSRQPAAAPEKRKPRRWRTGRTAQFNCRITPEAFAAFYAIADQQNWTVGGTVEQALAALQEKLGR